MIAWTLLLFGLYLLINNKLATYIGFARAAPAATGAGQSGGLAPLSALPSLAPLGSGSASGSGNG